MFNINFKCKALYQRITFFLVISLAVFSAALASGDSPGEATGRELFEGRCSSCHGVDGRGEPGSQLLKVNIPDFTDCSFASREPNADWAAVIQNGGPARGFKDLMPAHGDVLSAGEIAQIISYLHDFCSDKSWPHGDLNLPKPLVTEKAFPEDEAVVTTFANVNRGGEFSTELLYEKRIGSRAMVEIELPVIVNEGDGRRSGNWSSGIGDLAVGGKYVLHHDRDSGVIASVGAEVVFPTGNDNRGRGSGKYVFEPYLAGGMILPADSFAQVQLLGEFKSSGAAEIYLRSAFGKTFTFEPHGRAWSPMLEVIVKSDIGSNAKVDLDFVPQIQIPLNQRQHVRMSVGVWIPATRHNSRPMRVGAYLLWDWFDGGFFKGW